MGKLLAALAVAGLVMFGGMSAAGAEKAEKGHGVGICLSQVAIQPDLIEADRLGQVVSAIAGAASSGSDVPAFLEEVRNDGPGGCGEPPGPGHLG